MKFCPYFSQRLVNLLNLVHGKSEHLETMCYSFFPSNINGMFYIFHSENHSVLLLCRNFFLLCIWDNHHKRHHKQEYVRYTISFSQPFRHPKIGEIKLVGFAFLFHFYYIASFLKEWTGCQAYF